MAKKSRRARRGAPPVRQAPRVATTPGPEQLEKEVIPAVRASYEPARPAPTTGRRTGAQAEYSFDYSYVVHDLKRIGILATAMFGVLIALSFVLP
jgi:hypothetical protein